MRVMEKRDKFKGCWIGVKLTKYLAGFTFGPFGQAASNEEP